LIKEHGACYRVSTSLTTSVTDAIQSGLAQSQPLLDEDSIEILPQDAIRSTTPELLPAEEAVPTLVGDSESLRSDGRVSK
jgi:hypothetical protein